MSGAAPAPLDLARAALAHATGETLVRVIRERGRRLAVGTAPESRGREWDHTTVEVLAVRDGHTAVARSHRHDEHGAREAVRAAEGAAEVRARAGGRARAHPAAEARARAGGGRGPYPGLPEPQPCRPHEGHELTTAALRPADLERVARAVLDVEQGAGSCVSALERRIGLASTRGHELVDAATVAELRVDVAGIGRAARQAPALAALDPAALARRAALTARAATGPPAALPPGAHPVVLEAEPLGLLLGAAAMVLFDGRAHAEGRGPLHRALGTRAAASAVNLSDSPRFPGTLPRSFDAEGVPKAPLPLVQDGIAHRLVHDVRSAALAGGGARSTGHATEAGGESAGPAPCNLVLVGGGAADAAELMEPVARGLHVDHLAWAVSADDPPVVIAQTSGGAHLIEDGRIAAPLHDVRLEISPLDLLGRMQELGRRLSCFGKVVCPPARLRALPVTAAR